MLLNLSKKYSIKKADQINDAARFTFSFLYRYENNAFFNANAPCSLENFTAGMWSKGFKKP